MVQENCVKPKIVVITGPTAIGKSAIAVEVAKKYNGEIISADSMQVYRKMDVGTGKVMSEEMQGVPHHMLDVADPDVNYSVGQFVLDATASINSVLSRNKLPVLIGGTGLYISSLLNGNDFGSADTNQEIRDKWKAEAEKNGKQFVHDKLAEVDPESASKINVNDVKRVIRALEIYEITGKPKSQVVSTVDSPYDAIIIVMTSVDREVIYDRINRRVDNMFDSGLVDEVKNLIEFRDFNALQAIGYKEIISYFDGIITLDEAKELIKKNSRNYAKRQLTYFRGMKGNKHFIEFTDVDLIFNKIQQFLEA